MDIYKKGSDEFDPEYLAYLSSLNTRVSEGRMRVTRDGDRIVWIEFWEDRGGYYAYYKFCPPEWMNPK